MLNRPSRMFLCIAISLLCMDVFAQKIADPDSPEPTRVTPYTSTVVRGTAPICDPAATAIPDNTPAGLSRTITIVDAGTIDDLDVSLDVTHSWVGDIIVTLEHDGTTVVLLDQAGVPASTFGCSMNNISAVFDDAAAGTAENVCAASDPTINGAFQPAQSLAVFNGMDLVGDWTLTISDNAGGDTGTLDQWCLMPTGTFGVQIPTLGEWGTIVFITLLVAAALFYMRRNRQQLT